MFNLLPNKRLLIALTALLSVFVLLGSLQFFLRIDLSQIAWAIIAVTVAVIASDAVQLLRVNRDLRLIVTRKMPHHFIVGQQTEVALILKTETANPKQALNLLLFDHVPQTFELESDENKDNQTMPTAIALGGGEYAEIIYRVKPLRRGAETFAGTQFRLTSPMQLWQCNRFESNEDAVKIYPDFRRIDDNNLVTDEAHSHGTLPHHRKRGSGTDFAELREYQVGDSLNHIDHKATSRMNKLMSKSFQIERDQQVVILLDCSRRLRVFQNDLSHFDYALNSSIFLARTILNQGDAIGLMSFGNGETRYLQPKKGRNSVNRLLNQVYDLEPSKSAPDYVRAAEQLMARQKRRSLIIVVTSLQEEDTESLKTMLRILQKRHVVLIANLKEELLGKPITVSDLDDAIFYASREVYHAYRQQMMQQIGNRQLVLLDTYPSALTAKLINLYLNIKQSGRF